jgi:hypothetical protein
MTKESEELIRALLAFQESFRKEIAALPNDDAERAKVVVARANALLHESGVGAAFAPAVIEAVKPWPAWSKGPNFEIVMDFPVTDVSGSWTRDDADRADTIVVGFTYKGTPYQVKIIDGGVQSGYASSDVYQRGKAELWRGCELVLGLDISKDLDREFPEWKWFNVYVLAVGEWMKDVLEMETQMKARLSQRLQSSTDADAITRAANIKL